MATDHTALPLHRIFLITLLSCLLLLGTQWGFSSYFGQVMEAEKLEKVNHVGSPERDALRAQEDRILHAGPATLSDTLVFLSRHLRSEAGDTIRPEPSSDSAPLAGWIQAPKPLSTSPPEGGLQPSLGLSPDLSL